MPGYNRLDIEQDGTFLSLLDVLDPRLLRRDQIEAANRFRFGKTSAALAVIICAYAWFKGDLREAMRSRLDIPEQGQFFSWAVYEATHNIQHAWLVVG